LLNARLSSLYAAKLSDSVSNLGDTQNITLTIKTIDSRYALENEDVMGVAVKILLDCLFNPLLESDSPTESCGFSKKVTETEKQACIDTIEAELNEKRVYAIRRATELLCKGEPAAVHDRGTIERVRKITAESAYKAYQSLLETARIEIICVGCNNFYTVRETMTEVFARLKRGEIEDCHSKMSSAKSQILTHTEEMEVNQSKMVLGLKSESDDIDALTLMTKIYGGSATSKLFEKVREEMSLCYYCWSKFYVGKSLLIAECGVEKDKIEIAKDEILNQLELMKTSDFTDDEMNHAMLSMENDLKLVNDSLTGIKTWYLSKIYRCDIITPEQAIERYRRVTRERIVKAAESVVLDTVYILTDGSKTGGTENEFISSELTGGGQG
jgi:predicted Zn-dependent peptidase